MKKRNKILYWSSTIFLAVGMLAGGVQQMLQTGGYVDIADRLGYPLYLLSILGVWKILGIVALLIPNAPLVKEWAYAGFFFAMSGAVISHMAMGHPVNEVVPSFVLLIATMLSWYFRPADRKLKFVNQ
ncbi:MAG TPA: DoxX family protein [Segetibacter sp.]|jgi:uncharacterized membrane protein